MTRKLHLTLAALTLLGGAAVAVAVSADAPKQAPIAKSVRPNGSKLLTSLVVDDVNKKLSVDVTIALTNEGMDANYEYVTLEKIDSVVLTCKDGTNYSAPTIRLKKWENTECIPGDTLRFHDQCDNFKIGDNIDYNVEIFSDDKSEYKYSSTTLGLKLMEPERPALSESTDPDNPGIVISFVCPMDSINTSSSSWSPVYEPFPAGMTYTKIEVCRRLGYYDSVVIDVVDNPVPGRSYQAVDADAVQGSNNSYFIKTYTWAGSGEGSYAEMFYGDDFPADVSNVKATSADNSVIVTWDAPTRGYNNGRFDPASCMYKVERTDDPDNYYGTYTLLADSVTECKYIDDISAFTSETKIMYRITPFNNVEPTGYVYYNATSGKITVGPPSPLPFAESFNSGAKFNKSFDNNWEENYDYYSFNDHRIIGDTEQTIIVGDSENPLKITAGVNGGSMSDDAGQDGYYYLSKPTWYNDINPATLTSGNISFEGATNPVLSYYYIPLNNNNGIVEFFANTGELDSEGNIAWVRLDSLSYDDPDLDQDAVSTQAKWTKRTVAVPALAGVKKAQIRISFRYTEGKILDDSGTEIADYRYPMTLDEVLLDDYPAVTGLTAAANEEGNPVLTWELPESAAGKEVEYAIFMNDVPVDTIAEKTFTVTGLEQGEKYSFTVKALYGDIESPACAAAEFEVPLAYFDIDGVRYYVDGTEVNAQTYSGNAEAVTIPASVTYKEKTFTVTSVSERLFTDNADLKSLTVLAEVTEIPAEFCYGCTALESVELPATVATIGDKAFFGCAALKGIQLPADLATIGESAFQHCQVLTEIEFGDKLTDIKAAAFKNCSALAKVTFVTTTPPAVGADAFADIASPCEGVCPEEAVEAYCAVEGLKTITFRTSSISEINADQILAVEYFDLSGVSIAAPAKGKPCIAVVKFRNGAEKVFKIVGK